MAKMYYDSDADLGLLKGRKVAVIGYGSQGHAHALNLRDSGVDVVVGLPAGSRSRAKAQADGLAVKTPAEAAAEADIVMILTPDTGQAKLYRGRHRPGPEAGQDADVRPRLQHPLRDDRRRPPGVDVSMIAPKAPGHRVREVFKEGQGTPGLLAVHQDASGKAKAMALAYAKGIGCTRAGVIETTFAEETETDLFGEQAVLCGGASALVKAGFETLVKNGYQPEIAYFECMHELKLIVDLMYRGGLNYMRYSVSDTAEDGDYTAGPRIVTDGDEEGDAEDPRRDQGRPLREALGGGERGRPAGVRRHPRGRAQPAAGAGGGAPARHDAVPRRGRGDGRGRGEAGRGQAGRRTMTARITVFDTTLRDGEQSPGCSMHTGEKVRMALQLERLGVDIIEAGFPIASPGDFEAVQAISEAVRGAKVAALCRAKAKDIEAAGKALEGAVEPRHPHLPRHLRHPPQVEAEDHARRRR